MKRQRIQEEYRSHLSNSIVYEFIGIGYVVISVFVFNHIAGENILLKLPHKTLMILGAVWFLMICYRLGIRNHDVIIESKGIRIRNRVLFFSKNIFFPYTEIRKVELKKSRLDIDEKIWRRIYKSIINEIFPAPDGKYILIKVTSGEEYSFNCYGMEEDSYDEIGDGNNFDALRARIKGLEVIGFTVEL